MIADILGMSLEDLVKELRKKEKKIQLLRLWMK